MNSSAQSQEQDFSPKRRSLLGLIIGLIVSSVSAVLAAIAVPFAVGPSVNRSKESEWTEVCLWDPIPQGRPVKRTLVVTQDAGWGHFNNQRLIWIVKRPESTTVFSAVCPHLGCTINETAQGFICPCHGSAWNLEGAKLGGPAPRGMDILEHRITGGFLQVKYNFFQPGASASQAIG
jgi:Rieske Fe-S protein